MSENIKFNRENIDYYLKELAKEYKKLGGKNIVELIIVGGASVILNYEFRVSSTDIDCDYSCVGSDMKECINRVGDRLKLPTGWLNDEFKYTSSYSSKLREYSQYYKTFSNIVEFRVLNSEYLIAMKLISGRYYKTDLSDIAGIVYEQELKGDPITYEKVDKAVNNLYGGWTKVSNRVRNVFIDILNSDDVKSLYYKLRENEVFARDHIKKIEQQYSVKLSEDNVTDVIISALNMQSREKEDENEKK